MKNYLSKRFFDLWKNQQLKFLVLISILMYSSIMFSQGGERITVTGKVSDENGMVIPGVTIAVKGLNTGTITDVNGEYILNDVPSNGILVFSFIGMKSQEISVDRRKVINTVLKDEFVGLEEVVAVGYGTTKRRDLTGSVASVSAEALSDIPATSAMQAISGRLAGVNVTVTEGSPDAEVKIRVRGGGSITQDNSPLYIVDGFQVSSIGDIPPGDIETIDVLKDASSTAIYGAQGANGVILITTKSGKEGKTEININSYVGIKKAYNLNDVLSPYEFVYYQRELDPSTSTNSAFTNSYGLWEDIDIYKGVEGIDWQDQLYGNTGVQKNLSVSLNGGDKDFKYNLNYTRDDEDFIMLNSAYKRDYVTLKLSKKIGKKLSFNLTSRLSNTTIEGPSVSSGKKLRDGVKYAPVRSLSYLSEDQLVGNEDVTSAEALSSLNDPIFNTVNEYKEQNKFRQTYNASLSWDIIKGLRYTTKGSYDYEKNYTDNIWLKKTGEASSNGGQPVAKRTDQKGFRYSVQNTLTYDFDLNNKVHKFKLLAGQELYSSERNDMEVMSKFFPSDFSADDVLAMWNYGTASPTYTTINEPSRTNSYFGRLNYNLYDRYLLTLTLRADGKNVFAPNNRWGYFPGAAFAWRLSDEAFMDGVKDWMSNAKLRLSYGAVGNARVGSYWRQEYSFEDNYRNLYYINDEAQSALVTSSVLKNEDLTWETTISSNIGLDLGFFDQRLSVNIDAYKTEVKDLILGVALPSNSGYDKQYQNVGSTSNRGIEIAATGYIVDNRDFKLSASFNISFNRNKIEELDGSDELIASSGWGLNLGSDDFRAVVGQPVGEMYGYVSDGMYTFDDFTFNETTNKWVLNDGVVDASSVFTNSGDYFGPGHMKLKKLSGEGTEISPDEDRKVIGHAQPKHTGGFSMNASYKGFDFGAQFNWSYGNDIYNANKIDFTSFSGSKRYQNLLSVMSLDNRFTTIDPATGYNIMFGENANPELLKELNKDARIWHPRANSTVLTDWAIEDGSFLRLSNLTLGYTLPKSISEKVLMKKLRVYVTANNLKCWTKYTGQDPEVDTRRSTPLTPGVDYSAYPKAKTLLFGINVTF